MSFTAQLEKALAEKLAPNQAMQKELEKKRIEEAACKAFDEDCDELECQVQEAEAAAEHLHQGELDMPMPSASSGSVSELPNKKQKTVGDDTDSPVEMRQPSLKKGKATDVFTADGRMLNSFQEKGLSLHTSNLQITTHCPSEYHEKIYRDEFFSLSKLWRAVKKQKQKVLPVGQC